MLKRLFYPSQPTGPFIFDYYVSLMHMKCVSKGVEKMVTKFRT